MILLLLMIGLALGAPSDDQGVRLLRGGCPMFWYSFNGRCYKYVATHLSWIDAETLCLSVGANLVSIHSLQEEKYINALIRNFDPTQGPTWIGLSDVHREGTWLWSDGCAAKFVYWSAGQPDNFQGNEHCVQNPFNRDKKWNDIQCSLTFPSVCATRISCP